MNVFHGHSDVGKVSCEVILGEQFSVSLVSTKTNKRKASSKGFITTGIIYRKKIHLQKNFLLRQECQFLIVEIITFTTATNEITDIPITTRSL